MKKKVRGLKRKCNSLIERLIKQTEKFPNEYSEEKFWHLHVPVNRTFANSKNTPKKVRKLLIQTLINRSEYLSNLKPTGDKFCKVVCVICTQELSRSQIIIFFDQEYFASFFNRNNEEQVWTLQKTNESKIKIVFNIPLKFNIKRYSEIITDDGVIWKDELLMIGDLD